MQEGYSKSNLLNSENGFNTRVNLYIIRYLYYHMKKADIFMENGKGKRKVSNDIEGYIKISRQRLDRIFNGENFSMDAKTAGHIAGLFNISENYFKKDSDLIEIHGLTQEDWKCFFYERNNDSVSHCNTAGKDIIKAKEKVEDSIGKILKSNYVANHYDAETALYRIHYYFEKGVTFQNVSTLNKFLENLELLKISDWEEISGNLKRLKQCQSLLEKHYEYVSAYIKCREYEGE